MSSSFIEIYILISLFAKISLLYEKCRDGEENRILRQLLILFYCKYAG